MQLLVAHKAQRMEKQMKQELSRILGSSKYDKSQMFLGKIQYQLSTPPKGQWILPEFTHPNGTAVYLFSWLPALVCPPNEAVGWRVIIFNLVSLPVNGVEDDDQGPSFSVIVQKLAESGISHRIKHLAWNFADKQFLAVLMRSRQTLDSSLQIVEYSSLPEMPQIFEHLVSMFLSSLHSPTFEVGFAPHMKASQQA